MGGPRGGGKGGKDQGRRRDKGEGRGGARQESGGGDDGGDGRSRLSSNAPDFTPGATDFSCLSGGCGEGCGTTQGWSSGCDGGCGGCGCYGMLGGMAGGMEYAAPIVPLPSIWKEFADEDGDKYYYNSKTGLSQWERPAELDLPAVSSATNFGGSSAVGGFRNGCADRQDAAPARASHAGSRGTGGGRGTAGADGEDRRRTGGRGRGSGEEGGAKGSAKGGAGRRRDGKPAGGTRGSGDGADFGPPGCNLFVFHLPDDWTDDDLHEYFAPHGNVVSAKVMKELGTGRSRGFGFVSYDDRVSAATACKKMQSYKILGKRLKVEFKKGEGGDSGAGAERITDVAGDDEDGSSAKKNYPDDERLIGYLRAISAKNVVQSLKETEADHGRDAQGNDVAGDVGTCSDVNVAGEVGGDD